MLYATPLAVKLIVELRRKTRTVALGPALPTRKELLNQIKLFPRIAVLLKFSLIELYVPLEVVVLGVAAGIAGCRAGAGALGLLAGCSRPVEAIGEELPVCLALERLSLASREFTLGTKRALGLPGFAECAESTGRVLTGNEYIKTSASAFLIAALIQQGRLLDPPAFRSVAPRI